MVRLFNYYDDQSLSALTTDFLENSLSSAGQSATSGDVEFYRDLAKAQGGPVLDIGTGTGRVAWALAESGHEVLGVDLADSMLQQAEAKRARYPEAVGARVHFVRQDMAHLELDQSFPLILVPYRSFNHLLDPVRQRAALAALRRHLTSDGLLVLHMVEPSVELIGSGGDTGPDQGTLAITHPRTGQTLHRRIVARRTDSGSQTISHVMHYRVDAADGTVMAETEETLTHRWATQQEMRYLFELTGFTVDDLCGDFHGGDPAPGTEQIWLLRRMEDVAKATAALATEASAEVSTPEAVLTEAPAMEAPAMEAPAMEAMERDLRAATVRAAAAESALAALREAVRQTLADLAAPVDR